jgi:hypothetical protein
MTTGSDRKRSVVHLFRLGHHCFLDQTLSDNGKQSHLVYKVSVIDDRLTWWTLDPDWMHRLLKKDQKAIAHETTGGGPSDILLTAPSKDVRAFVLKYVEDPHAFGNIVRVERGKELPIADEGFTSKKQRTLDAWYDVCMTCRSMLLGDDPQPTAMVVKELERIAGELEKLSAAKGVDAEARECGKQAAGLYKAIAAYVKDHDGPQKLVEVFHRVSSTDRFGSAMALIDDKALKDQIAKTIEQFEKARAALEKRHGVKLMGIR